MESKKGKSVTTSVPSISIKFHANAEQIEELHFSDDDINNSNEKNHQLASINQSTVSSDQDSNPLKYFPKLVKRSTSIDVSAQSLSSSPPSDPWRFFSDIKGKITKSVEEKITEIKARHEEGSPLHKAKTEIKVTKDNKDNSSFSDSEDLSESSISKTCGVVSTTEGVEMSSDEDTPSIDKDKKLHSPSVRQRFRFLRSKTPPKEGTVNINNLSKLYNINTEKVEQALPEHSDDVESAVDALEETDFKKDSPDSKSKPIDKNTIINAVVDKFDNIEVDSENVLNLKEVTGQDIRESFFSGESNKMSTVFAPTGFVDVRSVNYSGNDPSNVLLWVLVSFFIVLYAILHTYTPYLAGLLAGTAFGVVLGYIYYKFILLNGTVATNTVSCTSLRPKIMEIPAVKEYQPLTKFEGWVNEYPDFYDHTIYHIAQTQSVFLRLQGNLLRISHSKSKVPKRAMWNEHEIKASFGHHRIYNLLHAKVTLLPEGLAKIRHWSKKYPICVTLNKEQMNFDPAIFKLDLEEDKDDKSSDKAKSPKAKKKFMFKKREYPYMAQRFSKLTEDQDIDLDSDSRASTPSPEILELTQDDPIPLLNEDKNGDDEMYSLPDDWSVGSHSRNESPAETKIYIFGRTDREKEDWFRRLAAATRHTEETVSLDADGDCREAESESALYTVQTEAEYLKYMTVFNKVLYFSGIMFLKRRGRFSQPSRKKSKSDKSDKDSEQSYSDKQNSNRTESKSDVVLWFNALIGRVLFDCMRDPEFTRKVKDRIQKKLGTIKLPYFIEEILITELSLGKTPPFILKTEKPVLDERGLWVDLDLNYEGLVVLTLQTKVNLMKLKNPQLNDKTLSEIKSAIYHSDVDDSAESSSDEEGPQELPLPKDGAATTGVASHGSKKFIKMVDRIAESKFFQAATENRYIKKAMEGVSNTDLRLKVELKGLAGIMVLNIPPPPSDRIWVGFRPVPELILTAHPIVGDRNVTYAMVTTWIEKKLLQEFQKIMVIPNMEDFIINVMNPKLPD